METHRYTVQEGYGGKDTGEELCARNVLRKSFRMQTWRLHNRLLNLCQRYRDNDIQLEDFLQAVGRDILEWVHARIRNVTSTT